MASTSTASPGRRRAGDPALAARLRRELEGEVLFDAFSRGRYSTDASLYQIEPLGWSCHATRTTSGARGARDGNPRR